MSKGWYLGRPVVVVWPLGNGWAWCRHADGRCFKHWLAQIKPCECES